MESELQECLNLINAKLISFTKAGRFTGFSGVVYFTEVEIDNARKSIVVKFSPFEEETEIISLNYIERVYQTRISNFEYAYKVMQNSNILIPKIYYIGQKQVDGKNYWLHIMEKLEGESIRAELEHKSEKKIDGLHKLSGEILGSLHSITRDFDGWTAQEIKPDNPWFDDFLRLLSDRLEKDTGYNNLIRSKKSEIQKFIEIKKSFYIPTKEFVFCHLGGGIQGMAIEENSKWKFTGLIDIEDLYFTDQSFSLAGLEISLNYNKKEVSESFWKEYKSRKNIPQNYNDIKGIYKLFYALEWLTIPYEDFDPKEESSKITIRNFEEYILDLIEEK